MVRSALQDQAGDRCPAQDGRLARLRPDQGRPRTGSVPASGPGEDEWGVGPDGHYHQPAEAVQRHCWPRPDGLDLGGPCPAIIKVALVRWITPC